MNNSKINIMDCGKWAALYINDKLVLNDYRVTADLLMDCLPDAKVTGLGWMVDHIKKNGMPETVEYWW